MLVRLSVGWSVRLLVGPHITSKTDYVAIPSRLGFGDPLVFIMKRIIIANSTNKIHMEQLTKQQTDRQKRVM
jgi:hypothetical protein